MNQTIEKIWKYLSNLKGRWGLIAKLSLAVLILSLSTYYLVWRFPSIIASGEKQIDTAVIAISAIIVLMPFLSEIELFGVKFKKEMEKMEKETSEKIRLLEQKITLIQTQNITQNFYPMKSDEELKRLTHVVQETVVDPTTKEKERTFQMPSQIYEMLATSYNLNRKLSDLYNKVTANSVKYLNNLSEVLKYSPTFGGLLNTTTFLADQKVIDSDMAEAIRETLIICQSARDGEEIVPIQYDFVKDTAPSIIAYLDDKLNELK